MVSRDEVIAFLEDKSSDKIGESTYDFPNNRIIVYGDCIYESSLSKYYKFTNLFITDGHLEYRETLI